MRESPEEMISWIEGRWMEWRRSTARMMEGGTMMMLALMAEEAAVEVGGGGGRGEGGLHDRNDATIGMINVLKRNDGSDNFEKGWQG